MTVDLSAFVTYPCSGRTCVDLTCKLTNFLRLATFPHIAEFCIADCHLISHFLSILDLVLARLLFKLTNQCKFCVKFPIFEPNLQKVHLRLFRLVLVLVNFSKLIQSSSYSTRSACENSWNKSLISDFWPNNYRKLIDKVIMHKNIMKFAGKSWN